MFNIEEIEDLSIYQLLERSSSRFPEQMAIIDQNLTLDYQTLKAEVDSAAFRLHNQGFQKGDRVGFMLPNSLAYILYYFAVHRLGGAVVQVNPLYQISELSYIQEDVGLSWFITEEEQLAKLKKISAYDDVNIVIAGHERTIPSIQIDGTLPKLEINTKEDIAVIQYTGGTTGQSKGVMLTHYNIVCNIHQSGDFFEPLMVEGEERILGVAPLTHAMAMTNMTNAVRIAATYIIVRNFNAGKVLKIIDTNRPTMMVGSPTMYIAFLNHPDLSNYDLTSFKICLSGSAPLPVEVLKELEQKTGAVIFEGYGLTEATTSTHRTPSVIGKRKIGSVGIQVSYTEAKIINIETGEETKPGESGELLVRGPQMMKGYWKKPVETRESIREGWLYTGDIALKDVDGYYYIVGRKKDMVIAGGLNIYPAEVEDVMYQHPSIAEVCAFGVPDAYLGEKLIAVIVVKDGQSAEEDEIIRWCEGKMARFKIPRQISFRTELPKTHVGKILRRKLVDEYKEQGNKINQ